MLSQTAAGSTQHAYKYIYTHTYVHTYIRMLVVTAHVLLPVQLQRSLIFLFLFLMSHEADLMKSRHDDST